MTARAPLLTPVEARVLGCLIEGSQVAPENYPMTTEQVMASCNRKDGRDPVSHYSREEVETALASLRGKGLVAFSSSGDDTLRYMDRAGRSGLDLSAAQMALLSLLLLRGPLSAVRLLAHSSRMHAFSDVDAVTATLDSMRTAEKPYVEAFADDASGDGMRYRHAFFVYGDDPLRDEGTSAKDNTVSIPREQLQNMQRELNDLRNTVQALQAELIAMREEFGGDTH